MKILITGALGQDGSYLSEYVMSLGHEVHGIVRGIEKTNYVEGVKYHIGDMRDFISLENIFRKVWPDEVYNLAGQVFVPSSWTNPEVTFDVNVGGLTRLMRIVANLKSDTKVYQASSSEMFGNAGDAANENTEMFPVSPYGVSKLASHRLASVYRDAGLHVVSGILFNHESPRRAHHMVTRKITRHVAKWARGEKDTLHLGNLNAGRDWGHAKDYVRAMYLMMQKQIPDDYVIGMGITHTVLTFLKMAIECAELEWKEYKHLVHANDSHFVRQNELHYLRADASKAGVLLDWKPEISFNQLVFEMVEADKCTKSKVTV